MSKTKKDQKAIVHRRGADYWKSMTQKYIKAHKTALKVSSQLKVGKKSASR